MRWWRTAVVYSVDVRVFGDAAGDGASGDLDGVRRRLGYLELLDVDALRLGPSSVCGPSDRDAAHAADADTASDQSFTRLLDRARAAGLRVLGGLAPGHVTTAHEWFRAARDAPSGGAERERLHVRPGRGLTVAGPPNDWRALDGGPAWSRLDADEWYLHLAGPGLPDLNWGNPEVWAETEKAVRAWCDRGVDGLWIDRPHLLCPRPSFPDDPHAREPGAPAEPDDPRADGDGVHEVHRTIRAVLDHYPGRIAAAGVDVAAAPRFARYGRPDELHLAVRGLRGCPFDAGRIRAAVESSLAAMRAVGAAPAWTLSGPDDPSPADRLGGADRARAMALLLLALPGAVVLDAGDELCLPGARHPGEPRGPMDWTAAAGQLEDPGSALSLHRRALELRRAHPGFTGVGGEDRLEWFGAPEGCLAFRRAGSTLVCALNTSRHPVPLPPGEVLLTSRPAPTGDLPPDTAAWLV